MKREWWTTRVRTASIGTRSERARRIVRRVLDPIVRLLHRPQVEGFENLPDGPFLLVANHSGGLGGSEIFAFAVCWLRRCEPDRPLAGVGMPFAFSIPPVSMIMRGLGAIPATREAMSAALGAGVPVLVFPGGDHEITRPFWQANTVDFAGRRGYLELARQAGVPVVPMGIRGSHWTVPTLWRSTFLLPNALVLPRLLGLKRWPLTVLGVAGALLVSLLPLAWPLRLALAWAWLASPAPLFPWVPSTIRFRIGRPLSPQELFAPDDERLQRAAARVQSAVQALVHELGAPAARPEPGATRAAVVMEVPPHATASSARDVPGDE